MRRSQPLFRLDAGWLFVLAGLAVIVAGAVVPPERELHELKVQLAELRDRERANYAALESYARFSADLEHHDPALVRRLAASQLNVIPKDETPLLMATSVNATVADWIESSVEPIDQDPLQTAPPPDTLLSRFVEGKRRLWALGGGAFAVFVGLMIAPPGTLERRRRLQAEREAHLAAWEEHATEIQPAQEDAAEIQPVPEEAA